MVHLRFLRIAHTWSLLIVSILCGNDKALRLRERLVAYCSLSMMCMIDDNAHYITVQEKGLMGTYWHAWQAPVSAFWAQISFWAFVQIASGLPSYRRSLPSASICVRLNQCVWLWLCKPVRLTMQLSCHILGMLLECNGLNLCISQTDHLLVDLVWRKTLDLGSLLLGKRRFLIFFLIM